MKNARPAPATDPAAATWVTDGDPTQVTHRYTLTCPSWCTVTHEGLQSYDHETVLLDAEDPAGSDWLTGIKVDLPIGIGLSGCERPDVSLPPANGRDRPNYTVVIFVRSNS